MASPLAATGAIRLEESAHRCRAESDLHGGGTHARLEIASSHDSLLANPDLLLTLTPTARPDALLMLKRHANEADVESAIRAEELAEVGNHKGAAVWRRVIDAIGQLENMTPPGLLH